jgi:putative oxidoreductase
MNKLFNIASRILMSLIFLLSGFGKIMGYAATQGYMAKMGVPGELLPVVIAVEFGGGLALLLGFQTRIVSFGLAGFCIVSALIFHNNFADQMQMINFLKNMAMAGGLLMFTQYGAGSFSIDNRAKA